MAEIRCAECGRRYETKSGLRRHVKKVHGGTVTVAKRPGSSDTPAAPSIRGFAASEDDDAEVGPRGACGQVLGRALRALDIKREDVLSYTIYADRVVVIEGPVGYKRTWMFPGGGEA